MLQGNKMSLLKVTHHTNIRVRHGHPWIHGWYTSRLQFLNNNRSKRETCTMCSENSRILIVTAAPPCPPCLMKPTFVLNYTMLIVAKAILKVIEPPWVLHGCSMGLALKLIIYILTIFQVQMNIHTFFGIALALYSLLHWAQITAAPDWHLPDIPDFRVRVT